MLKAGGDMSVARDRCWFDRKGKWFTATTHVVNSTEPPGADPHARWCGRGAVARPPYPDLLVLDFLNAAKILFMVLEVAELQGLVECYWLDNIEPEPTPVLL